MAEMKEKADANRVVMTAIIVTAIVAILCILACSAVAITFLMNPPW